jgi:hypothetical protein
MPAYRQQTTITLRNGRFGLDHDVRETADRGQLFQNMLRQGKNKKGRSRADENRERNPHQEAGTPAHLFANHQYAHATPVKTPLHTSLDSISPPKERAAARAAHI